MVGMPRMRMSFRLRVAITKGNYKNRLQDLFNVDGGKILAGSKVKKLEIKKDV